MPKSYTFQLNLDLTSRSSDPHFDVDFPEYSGIIGSNNFTEYCIPSGFNTIIELLISLANGESDLLSIDCRIRSKLNSSLFLPSQLHATFQKSTDEASDYYQCILTVPESKTGDNMPEILNSLFQHNPQSFCYLGLDGKVIRVNKRLEEFLMLPESVLVQHNYKDFLQEKDLVDAEQIFIEAANGVSNRYEFSVVLLNGALKRVRINIFPRFENRQVIGVYGIFEDITETVETQRRWKELVEQSPLPVLIFIDTKFVFTNSIAPSFYGLETVDELIGRSLFEFVPDSEREFLQNRVRRLDNNEQLEPGESQIVTKNGTVRHIIAHSRPIIYEGQKAIQSVIFDITDLRKQKEIIEKSLREKETLLKEIHHRVKNNLAIISGLIELQIQTIKDQGTIEVLRDSQNRIQSIALVHQQLYQIESLDEINLATYLQDLINGLNSTIQGSNQVDINIESSNINLSIEQAIPCSLIINEVVVNAFKHAFDGIVNPTIKIIIESKDDQVEVTVFDNGVGLQQTTNGSTNPSLGTTLINILTQQLDGNSHYVEEAEYGTCFKLMFPTI